MAAICFFAGLVLLFEGLIGEYIGRIFLGINNNPQFVVRRINEHGRQPYIETPDGSIYVLKSTDGNGEKPEE